MSAMLLADPTGLRRERIISSAESFTQSLEEPFCRGNITLRAEHKLNGASCFIHSALEVLTRLPDLDVSLVDSIRRAAHLQMRTDALVYLRSIALYPTKDGRVVYVESALAHHLFYVAVR